MFTTKGGEEIFGNMMVQTVGKQTLTGKAVGTMLHNLQVYLTMEHPIQPIQSCTMVLNHFMILRLRT